MTTMAEQPVDFSRIQNRTKLTILYGLAGIFLLLGCIVTPSLSNLAGQLKIILTHPSRVDFDSFFWTGELGAPFVQAGLSMLMILLFYTVTKTQILGQQLAAFAMVTGFSFYGQNILNMWFPVIGVFLYAVVFKKKFSSITSLAFLLTCLSPFFSFHAFGQDLLGKGSVLAFAVGAILAIIAGFFSAIFTFYFPRLHGGLLLFNTGLSGGWVAIIMASFLKVVGLGMDNPNYGDAYVTEKNLPLTLLLAVPFIYLILVGFALGGGRKFTKLFWHRSKGESHVEPFGFPACLIQMGVMGFIAVGYVWLVGGAINGAIFAGIWAMVGFSTSGSTLRTQLPLIAGIMLTAFFTGGFSAIAVGAPFIEGGLAKLASRGIILCALFTCGVAPIVGNFGILSGMLVALVHSALVPNIPPLHGWMLLYNNGFSLGIITVLLYPLYSQGLFRKKSGPLPKGAPKQPKHKVSPLTKE